MNKNYRNVVDMVKGANGEFIVLVDNVGMVVLPFGCVIDFIDVPNEHELLQQKIDVLLMDLHITEPSIISYDLQGNPQVHKLDSGLLFGTGLVTYKVQEGAGDMTAWCFSNNKSVVSTGRISPKTIGENALHFYHAASQPVSYKDVRGHYFGWVPMDKRVYDPFDLLWALHYSEPLPDAIKKKEAKSLSSRAPYRVRAFLRGSKGEPILLVENAGVVILNDNLIPASATNMVEANAQAVIECLGETFDKYGKGVYVFNTDQPYKVYALNDTMLYETLAALAAVNGPCEIPVEKLLTGLPAIDKVKPRNEQPTGRLPEHKNYTGRAIPPRTEHPMDSFMLQLIASMPRGAMDEVDVEIILQKPDAQDLGKMRLPGNDDAEQLRLNLAEHALPWGNVLKLLVDRFDHGNKDAVEQMLKDAGYPVGDKPVRSPLVVMALGKTAELVASKLASDCAPRTMMFATELVAKATPPAKPFRVYRKDFGKYGEVKPHYVIVDNVTGGQLSIFGVEAKHLVNQLASLKKLTLHGESTMVDTVKLVIESDDVDLTLKDASFVDVSLHLRSKHIYSHVTVIGHSDTASDVG